jgi:hypothetical protein
MNNTNANTDLINNNNNNNNNNQNNQNNNSLWKKYLLIIGIIIGILILIFIVYKFFFSSSSSSVVDQLSSVISGSSSILSNNSSDYTSSNQSESIDLESNEIESELNDSINGDDDELSTETMIENFVGSSWKKNIPYISKETVLLNSVDNLSKYRHACPNVYADMMYLLESFCKTFYTTITKYYNKQLNKKDLIYSLNKCQKLQSQTIHALHQFTVQFSSDNQHPDENKRIDMMVTIQEWSNIIKSILRNDILKLIGAIRYSS